MTTLEQVLTVDIWSLVAEHMSIHDSGAVACTCRAWRRIVAHPAIDRVLATGYARRVLGDASFWQHAVRRPKRTRRGLPTFRMEIKRIEDFRRELGKVRLAACELYALWRLLDSPAAEPRPQPPE